MWIFFSYFCEEVLEPFVSHFGVRWQNPFFETGAVEQQTTFQPGHLRRDFLFTDGSRKIKEHRDPTDMLNSKKNICFNDTYRVPTPYSLPKYYLIIKTFNFLISLEHIRHVHRVPGILGHDNIHAQKFHPGFKDRRICSCSTPLH